MHFDGTKGDILTFVKPDVLHFKIGEQSLFKRVTVIVSGKIDIKFVID